MKRLCLGFSWLWDMFSPCPFLSVPINPKSNCGFVLTSAQVPFFPLDDFDDVSASITFWGCLPWYNDHGVGKLCVTIFDEFTSGSNDSAQAQHNITEGKTLCLRWLSQAQRGWPAAVTLLHVLSR